MGKGFNYFVGGVILTVAAAVLSYGGHRLYKECSTVRNEQTIALSEIDGTKIRVVQQQRWGQDKYHIQFLDNKGELKVEARLGFNEPEIIYHDKSEPNQPLEKIADSNNL